MSIEIQVLAWEKQETARAGLTWLMRSKPSYLDNWIIYKQTRTTLEVKTLTVVSYMRLNPCSTAFNASTLTATLQKRLNQRSNAHHAPSSHNTIERYTPQAFTLNWRQARYPLLHNLRWTSDRLHPKQACKSFHHRGYIPTRSSVLNWTVTTQPLSFIDSTTVGWS